MTADAGFCCRRLLLVERTVIPSDASGDGVDRLGPPLPRTRAAMQQVADWLEKLGLGQYAQRFAESDISLPGLGFVA